MRIGKIVITMACSLFMAGVAFAEIVLTPAGISVFELSVVSHIPEAESKNNNTAESEATIQFGDPAHVFFFNYQTYLAQHGKDGETPESWNLLTDPERATKVADGEAFLKKLYAELLTKKELSTEEVELFQAVWGKSDPQAINNTVKSRATIQFGDPAHAFFFNYQTYLAQHGKDGETPESWNLLTDLERATKVAEGEAFLKKLHAELLAKKKLSAEETELFQAVWGKREVSWGESSTHNAAIVREIAVHVEKLNAISKNFESYQKTGNWNSLFDGSNNASKGAVAVPASPSYSGNAKAFSGNSLETALSQQVGRTKVRRTDYGNRGFRGSAHYSAEQQGTGTGRSALPLAAGALLLVGGCLGARMLLAKAAQPANSVVGAGKPLPMLGNHGFDSGLANISKPAAIGRPATAKSANMTVALHGCGIGECTGNCQSFCAVGCDTHCTSCEGGCGGGCGGTCFGCEATCWAICGNDNCGRTCAGTISA